MSIAEFLLARIAEDEVTASGGLEAEAAFPELANLAPFTFRRILVECEAKRRIVEMEAPGPRNHSEDDAIKWQYVPPVLALLALPYAGHRDYDEAWRP